jgi:rubrerythrin
MPICPHCGEEYRKGGTFTTHVQSCSTAAKDAEASTDGGVSSGVKNEVQALRARVERLEQEAVGLPSGEKMDGAIQDADRALERVGTLRDDLANLREEVEEIDDAAVFGCNECGRTIGMPWREPDRCPDCGLRFDWDAVEDDLRS